MTWRTIYNYSPPEFCVPGELRTAEQNGLRQPPRAEHGKHDPREEALNIDDDQHVDRREELDIDDVDEPEHDHEREQDLDEEGNQGLPDEHNSGTEYTLRAMKWRWNQRRRTACREARARKRSSAEVVVLVGMLTVGHNT